MSEEETLCINSTLPYTAVVFRSNTFLESKVYFDDNRMFDELLFIPGVYGGIDSGNRIINIEAQALVSNIIEIFVLSFPPSCSLNRYISNLPHENFKLDKFPSEKPIEDPICIWFADTSYYINVSTPNYSSVQLCSKSCSIYKYKTSHLMKKTAFIMLDPSFNFNNSYIKFKSSMSFDIRRVQISSFLSTSAGGIEVYVDKQIRKFKPKSNDLVAKPVIENAQPVSFTVIVIIIVVFISFIFFFVHQKKNTKKHEEDQEKLLQNRIFDEDIPPFELIPDDDQF